MKKYSSISLRFKFYFLTTVCSWTGLCQPSRQWLASSKYTYSKCSNISNTFLYLLNMGYQGWNSQVASQNSKQGRP